MINNLKKKFLILGFLNFLITNFVLQILLFLSSVLFATLVSQVINLVLGYYLYSKYVFSIEKNKNKFFLRYFHLAIFSWFINNYFINLLTINFLISKNISALLVIPLLTLLSFYTQKYYVFAKK
ncbi:GtrA family protein [Prochlorococcus marinus]